MQISDTISKKIEILKEKQDALILVHNYQRPEIQDIADFLGDSFALSKQAEKSSHHVIIFCGVDFMAESAKILSPDKKVIHPDLEAKCPMAAMVEPEPLSMLKEKHPHAAVVSYVNTSAEIKALSDICCTSSNAVKIIKSLKEKKIIFVPDTNLGLYIKRFVTNKEIIIWPGICPTHHKIKKNDIAQLKQHHPSAIVLVHPECNPDVIDIADHVLSTQGMINHVKDSPHDEFIIGTEKEICYRLKKENPNKHFYAIEKALCPNMKKIKLQHVVNSLETLSPQIFLDVNTIKKAKIPLQKMLMVGRGD